MDSIEIHDFLMLFDSFPTPPICKHKKKMENISSFESAECKQFSRDRRNEKRNQRLNKMFFHSEREIASGE